MMTPAQQQVLFENTARAMGDAREHIKQRHIDNCPRADPAYGAGRRKGARAQTERVGRLRRKTGQVDWPAALFRAVGRRRIASLRLY